MIINSYRQEHSTSNLQVSQIIDTMSYYITFAVVFIPRVDAVLDSIAHQGVVDTHVAVAEESTG